MMIFESRIVYEHGRLYSYGTKSTKRFHSEVADCEAIVLPIFIMRTTGGLRWFAFPHFKYSEYMFSHVQDCVNELLAAKCIGLQ